MNTPVKDRWAEESRPGARKRKRNISREKVEER